MTDNNDIIYQFATFNDFLVSILHHDVIYIVCVCVLCTLTAD